MKITLLVDNPQSWIMPFAEKIVSEISSEHTVQLIHSVSKIISGDLLFLLGCEQIIKLELLKLNKHTIVVHESGLPQGKGWSPLTWQILEGKSEIPITLFEAAESVDSGDIYAQEIMRFDGTELNEELKHAQGVAKMKLVHDFVARVIAGNVVGMPQVGEESFYPRRRTSDSEIDIDKTVREQFNLFRVVDNERYPAFFVMNGQKYILKIYKDKN